GYITRSLTVATNTAEVFFPQNPTKILRLVSYDVNGDTNTAILTIYSGTMPLTVTGIINVFIAATNAIPIATNDVIWICTNTAWTLVGSNTLRAAGEALFATQRRA